MTPRDIPNVITVLRILLVPPVLWLLVTRRFDAALILFALAGFSDALDGFLAKRYGWTSRIGALLDPLADKFLLVTCYVTLGWLALIPWWLALTVIVRDLIIVAGAFTYHYRFEPLSAVPTFMSKLNTAAQILLVLAVVWSAGVWAIPRGWLDAMVYSVLATTVLSGLDYIWTWGWRAWHVARGGSRR